MMNIVTLFIVLGTAVGSYLAYPQLPDIVPTHWNFQGQVDGYMSKEQAVWFAPGMLLFMYILFRILPHLDPNKKKYRLFAREWKIIQTALIGFFAFIQFVVFYSATHPEQEFLPLFFIGLGTLFVLLGNYLSKIRQNYFIGIKLPWTLADEDNWNKTHRFASWCFVGAGCLTLIEAFFIWYAPVIIFGSIMLSVVLPMIYSFLLYKKQADKMKYVLVGVLLILLGVLGVRLATPEDSWICDNGVWVEHGKPSAPMSSEPCE